jgi:DNA-directed RNA polymerase subunit delta
MVPDFILGRMWPDLSDNLALEKVRETSMVDLAYDLLKNRGESMPYKEIMDEVAKLKGFSDEDVEQYIAQLFTEINIDGRFVRDSDRKWGLREWYSVEEAAAFAVAVHTKDDEFEDEDLEDVLYADDDEESFGEAGDMEDLEDLDLPFNDDEDSPFAAELDEEMVDGDEDEEDL